MRSYRLRVLAQRATTSNEATTAQAQGWTQVNAVAAHGSRAVPGRPVQVRLLACNRLNPVRVRRSWVREETAKIEGRRRELLTGHSAHQYLSCRPSIP